VAEVHVAEAYADAPRASIPNGLREPVRLLDSELCPVYEAFCGAPRPSDLRKERLAPVPASTARKSPVGKNRVLVTATAAPAAPAPQTEQTPSLARLTAVLAVCFSAGVAWPIVGGLQFVQRPPGSSAPKPPEPEPDGAGDSEPSPTPSPALPALRAAPLGMDPAHVENRVVESCEGNAGEALARCDMPRLDTALEAPLAQLSACGRARGAKGVLSLGMLVDFPRGKIAGVKLGQSTTLSEGQAAALLACAEESVVGTSLDDVVHAHARYWIYYVLRFGAAEAAASGASSEVVSTSGQATVGWKTAIVREGPSSQAPIAARLGFGTRISVTGRAGDWYRIERAGKALGWVHHEALGL